MLVLLNLVEEKKEALKISDLIQLRAALLEFAVECYPGEFEVCTKVPSADVGSHHSRCVGDDAMELETLLLAPGLVTTDDSIAFTRH